MDLYASEVKLVVEVDGRYHEERAGDARRDRALERLGMHVLRVSAALVMNDLAVAVECVRADVQRLRGYGPR